MKREWTVGLYEDRRGRKPVQAFLEDLAESRPADVEKLRSKFDLLTQYGFQNAHEIGLLKPVGEKVFELKVKGTDIRVLLFLWHSPHQGRLFMLAAGEIKKTNQLDQKTIRRAERRREDWFERREGGGSRG